MEKLVVTEDKQNRAESGSASATPGVSSTPSSAVTASLTPVAALFVDGADGMQSGLHDGTSTAVLLAGAFLDEGFELVDRGLAPSSVVVGTASPGHGQERCSTTSPDPSSRTTRRRSRTSPPRR